MADQPSLSRGAPASPTQSVDAVSDVRRAAVLKSARLLVFLVLVAAFLSLLALFPTNLNAIQSDWQINLAYPALAGWLDQAVFAFYILILRYCVAGVLLFTAGLLVWFGGLHGLCLLTAALFACLPVAFNLGGYAESLPYPAPWGQILDYIKNGLSFVGLAGLFLFPYLFPNGRFTFPWFARLGLLLFVGMVGGFAALLTGLGGDWLWFGFGILALANLLVGTTSLVWRYRRTPVGVDRNRIRPVLAAWLGLSSVLLFQVFGSPLAETRPLVAVLVLHAELLVFLALPGSLLISLARHNLWQIDLRPHRRAILAAASTALLLTLLASSVYLWQARLAAAQLESQAAALLAQPVGPVIVDTDLGNDDVLALLFLMQHPGVDLQAVTVTGTGLVHCQPGIRNVHGLLELVGYAEIPVTCGTETPLAADHEFPAAWRAAADRLWGLNLPLNQRQPAAQSAPDLLVDLLTNPAQPVTLVALGPLTNLAQAFQANPAIVANLKQIYIMGGAVTVPGNVFDPALGFDNQTAEWNFYADPLAAAQVFESGAAITLVPLDATNYTPVTPALFQRLQAHHPTRPATFTFNIFYINQGWIQTGKYYLWDTLAAAVSVAAPVARYQDYSLVVVAERGPDFGRTLPSPAGAPVRVAVWADAALFEELFIQLLNRAPGR